LIALFVHDHRFYADDTGIIYSPGKLPYEQWTQYLHEFDKLIIVGRKHLSNDFELTNLNISSGEKVSFELVSDITDPFGIIKNGSKVYNTIKRLVNSVDAVIARTSLLGYMASEHAYRLGKPWAAEVVSCSWDAVWNYGNRKGRLTAPLYYLWQRRMVKRAPFALYVTQKFLQKRYPSSGYSAGISDVNIKCIDTACLQRRKKRVETPGNPFVFGLIGSLQTKWKGIQTALEALKAVQGKLPHFIFRILGDGDQCFWKNLAASYGLEASVKFDGTLPSGDSVFQWLDGIDVYLQPSFQEGLPRSLVEAMSRGCPAIGSTAGGIPELLESDVLHLPGDAKHLGKIIIQSLDNGWRLHGSVRNFEKAKYYRNELLNERRSAFWLSFSEYVQKKGFVG
jgi:glycosyltransferase involved in cell wall biosynthesis